MRPVNGSGLAVGAAGEGAAGEGAAEATATRTPDAVEELLARLESSPVPATVAVLVTVAPGAPTACVTNVNVGSVSPALMLPE